MNVNTTMVDLLAVSKEEVRYLARGLKLLRDEYPRGEYPAINRKLGIMIIKLQSSIGEQE